MKIALIGNMNNNNFSIMRYFRDLGADAHLLIYSNDGVGSLSHFTPESDTFNIEKWQAFIHKTDIENGPSSVLFRMAWWGYYIKSKIDNIFRHEVIGIGVNSKRYLRSVLSEFDAYIGSGLSPAILKRIDISLDIFYPYSIGIEFLGSPSFLLQVSSRGKLSSALHKLIAQAQEKGIRRARFCLNAEMSLTKNTFEKIGVKFLPVAVPMVYNREILGDEDLSQEILKLKFELQQYDFKVISHSRLMWINPGNYTDVQWEQNSKHNDWLINSFAEFNKVRPETKAILMLLEYGPDVEHAKKLCGELGINHIVKWLPKCGRREIMQIIGCCNIGAGEFYTDEGVIWGGTGWEVLASGKPLIQGFRFKEGAFESTFGYPPPPMLPVVDSDCILKHLIDIADHPEKGETIGSAAAVWFNRYNGIGLAKQWLDLLMLPREVEGVVKKTLRRQGVND